MIERPRTRTGKIRLERLRPVGGERRRWPDGWALLAIAVTAVLAVEWLIRIWRR